MNSIQVQQFMNAGYSFIPCGTDARPWVESWEEYQYQRPEPDDIASMPFLDAPNVAIIAGEVSGGVECLDFDIKNDPKGSIWEEFGVAVREKKITDILRKTTIQETKSGGYHVIYKCNKVGRNEVLAKPAMGNKPIIETRANGGYFLVHPSHRYTLLQGSILSINEITPEEREQIMEVCKSLNRQPETETLKPKSTTQPKKRLHKTVEKIVQQLENAKVDITADYHSWVKVGHGLAHHFGEDGRSFFHRVSQFHPDYSMDDTNKKYDNLILQKYKRKQATIKSFFAIARDYGVDISDPDDEDVGPVEKWVVAQALRWNQVTNKIEDQYGEPVDDFTLNGMWMKCRRETGKKVSRQIFDATVFNYEFIQSYNPITEYMDSLMIRDYPGNPLQVFLSHLELKDKRWAPFIHKWLLSVVAAAYGHTSELVLVFMGPQNNGKTEFFRRLFPKALRPYYAEDKLDHGKDSDILMTQKLIIMDDEFGGKSKKDARHFKAMASKKVLSVRMPYGRVSKDLTRLAVLCGSTNNTDIVNDNTGNRRILPVEVLTRDFKVGDSVNREDLWAQLVQEYFAIEDDFGWKLTSEQHQFLKDSSEDYQAVNSEREMLVKYFKKGDKTDKFLTASEIADKIIKRHPSMRIWPVKMGQELTQLGYERVAKKIDGMSVRGYYVIERNFNENGEEVENLPF